MTENLYSAAITSQGMKNALMRARQYTDLSWTPLADTLPMITRKDGERIYTYYSKGETYTGIPYSSVYETDTYVGSNISPETFVSAACSPRSYLYTRDLRHECKEPKAAAFYGTVCSKFVQTVLGIDEIYTTPYVGKIDGMQKQFPSGGYTAGELVRCDVLLCPTRHTAIITDILSNEAGEIRYIEVSEETTNPHMQRKQWELSEFFAHFEGYDVFRYAYLDRVPYAPSPFVRVFGETHALDDRRYDVLTRRGDKCNIPSGEEVTLDVLTTGWELCRVFKDGVLVSETEAAAEIHLGTPGSGYYEVLLASGERASRPCFFCVTECAVTAESAGSGKVRVTYSCSAGKPVWIQPGNIGACCFVKADGTGDEVLDYDLTEIKEKTVRVGFKNEYGIYISPGAAF